MNIPSPVLAHTGARTARSPRLIDADVHQALRSPRDLLPYLPEGLHHRSINPPGAGYHNPHGVMRRDAAAPDGGAPGSDPELIRQQLLDAYGVDYAILNGSGILGVSCMCDAHLAAAVASAYNDWLIAHWLSVDDRFLGSLLIATQDPQRAAAEIDRLGDHPRIVQVIMASGARAPYGQVHYHPIYAAAERHNLPVAIHPGTEGAGISNPPTAAGWPSTYLEWHTCLSQNYMAHTVSLVCEGVFVKFPRLKFVLIEGGVAWLPHLMWRLDKNWKALRMLAPWLEAPPSEYIKRHIRITTQPIEEPENPEHLLQIIDMADAWHMLMFASDYPHWDFDSPAQALPRLPEDRRRRIMADNARELYGL